MDESIIWSIICSIFLPDIRLSDLDCFQHLSLIWISFFVKHYLNDISYSSRPWNNIHILKPIVNTFAKNETKLLTKSTPQCKQILLKLRFSWTNLSEIKSFLFKPQSLYLWTCTFKLLGTVAILLKMFGSIVYQTIFEPSRKSLSSLQYIFRILDSYTKWRKKLNLK